MWGPRYLKYIGLLLKTSRELYIELKIFKQIIDASIPHAGS